MCPCCAPDFFFFFYHEIFLVRCRGPLDLVGFGRVGVNEHLEIRVLVDHLDTVPQPKVGAVDGAQDHAVLHEIVFGHVSIAHEVVLQGQVGFVDGVFEVLWHISIFGSSVVGGR